MKKTFKLILLSLMIICCMTGCNKLNNNKETTTDTTYTTKNPVIDEEAKYGKTSDIDISDLNKDNARIRFFSNTLGTTTLPDNYYLKLELLNEMNGKACCVELTHDKPVVLIDIPKGTYSISVEESSDENNIHPQSKRFDFLDDANYFQINIAGKSNMVKKEDIKTKQKKEKTTFFDYIRDDALALILLFGCAGVLIYRKKVLKQ